MSLTQQNKFDINETERASNRLQVFNDCVTLRLAEGPLTELIQAVQRRMQCLVDEQTPDTDHNNLAISYELLKSVITEPHYGSRTALLIFELIDHTTQYTALRGILIQLLKDWEFETRNSKCVAMVRALGVKKVGEALDGLFLELFTRTAASTFETEDYFRHLNRNFRVLDITHFNQKELKKFKLAVRDLSRRDALTLAEEYSYDQFKHTLSSSAFVNAIWDTRRDENFEQLRENHGEWLDALITKVKAGDGKISDIGHVALHLNKIADKAQTELPDNVHLAARVERLKGEQNNLIMGQVGNWCRAISTPVLLKDVQAQIQPLLDQILSSVSAVRSPKTVASMLAYLELNQLTKVN